MKVRALYIAALIGAAIWLMSCGHYICHTTLGATSCNPQGAGKQSGGGGPGNGLLTAFVYFLDDTHGQFAAEGVNVSNSGTFASVSGFASPLNIGSIEDSGIVIVNKKYLYVAAIGGSQLNNNLFANVYGFSIDGNTAALTAVPNSPYAVPALVGQFGTPFTMAADPLGRFVFLGDSAGISVYAINQADGSLTLQNAIPVATGISSPIQMVTDGLGKYLYVLDGANIAAFAYASGALVSVGGTNAVIPSTMQVLASEPTGKYMLGVTKQLGGGSGNPDTNVYVFAITQAGGSNPGSLGTPVSFSQNTTDTPSYVAVHPNGQYVYTFNETTAVTGFSRQEINIIAFNSSTGALGPVTAFPTVLADIGKFDQSGTYLFAIGQETNATAAGMIPITVASNGSLSVSIAHQGVPGTSFAVTDAP